MVGKEHGLESKAYVYLYPTLSGCMSLGKSLSFSTLSFLVCSMGVIISTALG